MKSIAMTLALAASMLSAPVSASSDTGGDLYTSLKRFVDSVEGEPPAPDDAKDAAMFQSVGYVLGVWDGIMIARVTARKDTSCMPAGVSNVALARTILRHIDATPKDRSTSSTIAVANALIEAYPCLKHSK